MSKERKNEERQVRKANQEKSLVDWEADTGYEFGKCNKAREEEKRLAKEAVEFIKEHYGDVLRRLADS